MMIDVFQYNGPIRRGLDLDFIEYVSEHKEADDASLILTTGGGDPDAAYKIGRYLQQKYKSLTVIVPGLCKSAGTLLAIAANEVAFAPYGELGPLDIQLTKVDNLSGTESGLNIQQAFETLQDRAKTTFHTLIQEIITSSGGIVSFHTASHSASEIVAALYGPIFARMDPEEVGSRTRSMQIAAAYGHRLNLKHTNLKAPALHSLAQTYPSHGFVIDLDEASEMFHRVRQITASEKLLVETLGQTARWPRNELTIKCLSQQYADFAAKERENENSPERTGSARGATEVGEPDHNEGNREGSGSKRKARANGAETAVAQENTID